MQRVSRINKNFVYLIFFKKKNPTLIDRLFNLPYSSMGSIIENEVYRFKSNNCKMSCTKFERAYVKNNYDIFKLCHISEIPNVEKVKQELLKQDVFNEKFLNTRTNCVRSQQPLLSSLGNQLQIRSILDFNPNMFIKFRKEITWLL